MQRKTWFSTISTLGATALIAVGCGGGNSGSDGGDKAEVVTNPATHQALLQPRAGAAKVDLPDDAVAKVGDRVITKEAFEAERRRPIGPQAQVVDPPDYTKCIANLKKNQAQQTANLPKATKDKIKQPDEAMLKTQCAQLRTGQIAQAMTAVVSTAQAEEQAHAIGIKVSAAEVDAMLKQMRSSMRSQKAYDAYLKQTGLTPATLREQMRLTVLRQKLNDPKATHVPTPTESEIKAYYKKNKQRFGTTTLAKVHDQVRAELQNIAGSKIMAKRNQAWKAKTACRAGYVVALCANG